MSRHIFSLPDLVVGSGDSDSNVLYADGVSSASGGPTSGAGFRDAESITIFAPDTLAETATIYVDSNESGTNFNPLKRAGVAVTIGAGDSLTITDISFRALKIHLGSGAAVKHTFAVNKAVWI